MTTATATITGTITVPSQAKAASVTVKFAPYTENLRLVHPDGVVEGWELVTIDPTVGTWTIDLPLTGQAGVSPAGALWQAQERATNGAIETTVFDLTADIDWGDIVPVADLPVTPSVLQEAIAARDAALAAEAAAQAAQAAAQAVPTSNDTIIAGRISDTTPSASRAALLASFADLASLPEVLAIKNGVKADSTTGLDGTDDSTALNTLITAVSALGGGRIKLPAGVLRLEASLVPKNGVIIEGAGMTKTRLMPKLYGFNGGTLSTSAPLTDFHLRDFTIDGTNMTAGYKGYHAQFHLRCSWQNLYVCNTQFTGLGPDYLRHCYISNCVTENTGLGNDGTMPGGNGIGVAQGGWPDHESCTIVGCTSINAKRMGIMVEGGDVQGGARIIGCAATGCGDAGIGIGGGTGSLISGCFAYANTNHGILIGARNDIVNMKRPGAQDVVEGNICRLNGSAGISYDATLAAPVGPGCAIRANLCGENGGNGIEIKAGANTLLGLDVSGNTTYKNVGQGILLSGTTGGLINYSKFDQNIIAENVTLTTNGTQVGVSCDLTGCSISRNRIYHHTTNRKPINIGLDSVAHTLTGCTIEGNNAYGATTFLTQFAGTVLTGCAIRGNLGDTATVSSITVTASPFTYTAGSRPETVYIDGGTVSLIVKGGVTLRTSTGASVPLGPNESVVVTYSAAPTMKTST